MFGRPMRQVQGTGYWGKQVRSLQGVREVMTESDCDDVPNDFLETVRTKVKIKRKKSLRKKVSIVNDNEE